MIKISISGTDNEGLTKVDVLAKLAQVLAGTPDLVVSIRKEREVKAVDMATSPLPSAAQESSIE
jgi:hypothetical protein